MKTNIALIGFMGTGKSVAGWILAEKLGLKFVETDQLIERIAGKSIPAIFRDDGEIAFREKEIEAIKRTARGNGQVIACGGGIVLNKINIDRLRETSQIICLTASPYVIVRRISVGNNERPLLDVPDQLQRIRALLKARKLYYEQAADFTIDTSRLSTDEVADRIIEYLKANESSNLKR